MELKETYPNITKISTIGDDVNSIYSACIDTLNLSNSLSVEWWLPMPVYEFLSAV